MTLYHAADLIMKYPDKEVKEAVKELVSPGLSTARLWFPTRMSNNAENEYIKSVLRGEFPEK